MALSPVRIMAKAILLLALMPSFGNAHQLQVAMTTVTFVARTGSIEVIHRFYTHDTEHALSSIAGKPVDIVSDEAVQQDFGRYVGENFQLLDQDRKNLPLSLVGVELEDDFIWVYQETKIPRHLSGLSVVNSALVEVLPEQVNTVNVECAEEIDTLVFSGESRAKPVEIDFSACSVTDPEPAILPIENLVMLNSNNSN